MERSFKNRARVGDISELIAASWFLKQGYEVFQNIARTGPIDLIAVKGDETIHVDVKTVTKAFERLDGSWSLAYPKTTSDNQEGFSVRLLYVYPEDDLVSFDIEDIDTHINASQTA